jgi:hypothetical protein
MVISANDRMGTIYLNSEAEFIAIHHGGRSAGIQLSLLAP